MAFNFELDGKIIKIYYEEIVPGRAVFPSYKPQDRSSSSLSKYSLQDGQSEDIEFSNSLTVDELKKDISSLMPKSLEEPEKHIPGRLVATLKNHIEKFGRLLHDDLNIYIDETILVMKSIDRATGQPPFDDNEAKRIFNNLHDYVTGGKT